MNGYICYWRNQRVEIYADTLYQAQQKAQVKFGPRCKKGYEITVGLAEVGGVQVVHVAVD